MANDVATLRRSRLSASSARSTPFFERFVEFRPQEISTGRNNGKTTAPAGAVSGRSFVQVQASTIRIWIAPAGSRACDVPIVKKPTREERKHMCLSKRRYRTQGDALDAAAIAGVERRRRAYRCGLCGHWHLTSA